MTSQCFPRYRRLYSPERLPYQVAHSTIRSATPKGRHDKCASSPSLCLTLTYFLFSLSPSLSPPLSISNPALMVVVLAEACSR